jgi:hypothetical protein
MNFSIRERCPNIKEQLYREFLSNIALSNGLAFHNPKTSFPAYKYYIGKGNNSMLVKMCFKNRWWWVQGDIEIDSDWESYNFIWT